MGRKRPQLNIQLERLALDPHNPRLPEEIQGRPEQELLEHLYSFFNLEEIADPMGKNGYFDEEPLVVVPKNAPPKLVPPPGTEPSKEYLAFIGDKKCQFTVVEGNRRLATAKILVDASLRKALKARHWPTPTQTVVDDLNILPAIVYPSRAEVLPYLGVRHIIGNKKWDSYAKARYIVSMLKEGHSIDDIEREIGDHAQSVRKNALAYYLLQEAVDELDIDITNAKGDFSYLLLAIGQRNIKVFLGWTTSSGGQVNTARLNDIQLERPVADAHLPSLKDLLSWLYGDKKVRPVISESRDITSYLAPVVASPKAVEYLRSSRNLIEAYDLTDGEEAMIRKQIRTANTKLEKALGVAHRHRVPDVVAEAEKCTETAKRVLSALKEPSNA